MCAAKRNRALAPALLALRPALTEARLMTEKHACDEIYVATLAEELRRIESKIAAAEEVLHLPQNSALNHTGDQAPSVVWLRERAGELDLRLRRIEQYENNADQKKGALLGRPVNIAFA